MMHVQAMRDMVDPITEGTLPPVVQHAARAWGATNLRYVRSSANHLFACTLADAPAYLRLTPAQERTRDAIAAELAFIEHAANAGIAVARPLPLPNKNLILESASASQRYHAVLFEGISGSEYEAEDLDLAQCSTWGQTLGQLHRAARTFPHQSVRPTWRTAMTTLLAHLPSDENALRATLTAGLAWCDTLPDHESLLLHGDCEADNLIWREDGCTVIDFDDALYGLPVFDIAIALADLWWESQDLTDERLRAFLGGYATAQPLPDGLLDALPQVQRLLVGIKIARLLRAYAGTAPADDPPWLATLRERHHTWLEQKRRLL